MTLAQATLVQRIRYELGDRPWEDPALSAASNTSTITGATVDAWANNDRGEFITDGDTFLVTGVAGTTLTAVRSYWGSTGAAHTSIRVMKNPRYHYTEITNAISSVIASRLWPWAWKKVGDTVAPTPSSGTVWYDLATDARGLISVRQLYGASSQYEGRYGPTHRFNRRARIRRNMTSTLVASGVGITFPEGYYHDSNTINIDYAAKITDATTTPGTYDDFSAGEAVVEAIIFGAVAHLEGGLENRKPRQPRQDRETLRGAALYDRQFEDALARAHTELMETIPILSGSKV